MSTWSFQWFVVEGWLPTGSSKTSLNSLLKWWRTLKEELELQYDIDHCGAELSQAGSDGGEKPDSSARYCLPKLAPVKMLIKTTRQLQYDNSYNTGLPTLHLLNSVTHLLPCCSIGKGNLRPCWKGMDVWSHEHVGSINGPVMFLSTPTLTTFRNQSFNGKVWRRMTVARTLKKESKINFLCFYMVRLVGYAISTAYGS